MNDQNGHDFDILEMPVQGLAAYWLSLKKLIDSKKGKRIISEEMEHATEPFIRHLLDIVFSPMPGQKIRILAANKKGLILGHYRRKLTMMASTCLAMAKKENPRITFIRMLASYPTAPIGEAKAFEMAQAIQSGLNDPASDEKILLSVDHKLKPDQLVVKLLYYLIRTRRDGLSSLDKLIPMVGSVYFQEGLALVHDGFDPRFIKNHLESLRMEILTETRRKMDMSLEMSMGIRSKLSYDHIFSIARSFMDDI